MGTFRRLAKHRTGMVSLVFLTMVVLFSFAGPLLVSHKPNQIDVLHSFAAPTALHPLGTDELGRDILVRLMYGGRITLQVGVVAMLVSLLIGAAVGLTSGFYKGWAEYALMRLTDTFMAVPAFFVMLAILTFFPANLATLVMAIGVTSWMNVARVVRSEVLKIANMDYMDGGRALGATGLRLMLRHALPNAAPTIIVSATLGVAWAVLVATSLSYLGLGIQPPTASWGNMLSSSQNYFWISPLLVLWPGLLIVATIMAVNFLGEALRDVLSPGGR